MGNCLYLYNNDNYIKELAITDNTNKFNAFTSSLRKQIYSFCIGLFVLFLSITLYGCFLNKIIFCLLTIVCVIIVSNIFSLHYFTQSYNQFILMCTEILKFETIAKQTKKIIQYQPTIKSNYIEIIQKLNANIERILKIKQREMKEDYDIYEIYLENKQKIFIELFNEYHITFCENKSHFQISILCSINSHLKQLIRSYIRAYEEMLNCQFDWKALSIQHVVSQKDKKEIANITRIYDMIDYNLESNKDYTKLINMLNETVLDTKDILTLIDEIIAKKQLSISSIEKFKENIKEINDKENKEKDELNEKEDLAEEIPSKRNDTSVSLLELTLGEDFNKKEEVTEEKEEKFTYVSPLEMIRGQQEVKELKDSLVEQLEEYYYKLNKQKEK